ncbi:hypothetical protein BC941DRAFT_425751 [Chlamydoabsidia padenii]|nr:hypothetical protein BC941DRAFT_425751 [Chlamydoabsidia padenii]
MKHKKTNLMNAHQLGDAMGKVTLGPTNCDSILAEKAGYFLMRMVIDESKRQRTRHPVVSTLQYKKEATRAKAKSYNRQLQKRSRHDWFTFNDIGLKALQDGYPPTPPEKQTYSIFDTTTLDPLLFRLFGNATYNNVVTRHSSFDLDSNSINTIKDHGNDGSGSFCHAFDDIAESLKRHQHHVDVSSNSTLTKFNLSLFSLKLKSSNTPLATEKDWFMNNKDGLDEGITVIYKMIHYGGLISLILA